MGRHARPVTGVTVAFIVACSVVPFGASGSPARGLGPRGPITITVGGTYTGNWVSTDSTPAVRIATAEPVAIVDSTVTNLAGGTLIESTHTVPTNVMLDRVSAFGGTGRFYEADNFQSITIRRCTVDKTSGIHLAHGDANSSVRIRRNRQRNIQRGSDEPRQLRSAGRGSGVRGRHLVERDRQRVTASPSQRTSSASTSAHSGSTTTTSRADQPMTHTSRLRERHHGRGRLRELPPTSYDNEIWNNTVVDHVGGNRNIGGHDNCGARQPHRPGRQAAERLAAARSESRPGRVEHRQVLRCLQQQDVGQHRRLRRRSGRRNDMWFPDAPNDYAPEHADPGQDHACRRASRRSRCGAASRQGTHHHRRAGARRPKP